MRVHSYNICTKDSAEVGGEDGLKREEEEGEGAVLTLPPPFAKRAGRRQLLGAAPVPRRCRSLLKSVQCIYFFTPLCFTLLLLGTFRESFDGAVKFIRRQLPLSPRVSRTHLVCYARRGGRFVTSATTALAHCRNFALNQLQSQWQGKGEMRR